jgi:hypothetical protein
MGIDDTTKRMQDLGEQAAFLGEALLFGNGAPIERQERDGQRQLVSSDRLPSDFQGDRTEWEALGFTFGEPDPDDPMFMPATLPEGWKREGSDHAMWSYIVDRYGHHRVAIFYKAAFYDRSAFMRLESLDWYVTCSVEYDGGPVVFDDEWATTEAVTAALARLRDENLAEAEKYRRYSRETNRTPGNQEKLREIAAEKDVIAAKYSARLDGPR